MNSGETFIITLCIVGLILTTGWGVIVARRESLDRLDEARRRRLVQRELERYEDAP